ncbi:MAG TPA: AraC family transcriptional regulator [Puia sp.]|nr:AraC family transcriptional regulator [Puia sp.]
MIKEQLYEPFSISVETLNEYKGRRQTAFFELVYILSGTGKKMINGQALDYKAGVLFLVTPQDTHCFQIETTTQFFFLRFNNICLKSQHSLKDNLQRLEAVLHNANQRPCSILQSDTDGPLVGHIVDTLIREQVNRDVCWDKLTLHLVNSLLVIVGRSLINTLPSPFSDRQEEKALDILQYIQANIYSPELIKAERLGKTFGISITYLSRYFKKQTGKTMQDYISHYKTKLIENRLQYSKMRISEIADELGFTDESHLTKFFKKQHGSNPTQYRREKQQLDPAGKE